MTEVKKHVTVATTSASDDTIPLDALSSSEDWQRGLEYCVTDSLKLEKTHKTTAANANTMHCSLDPTLSSTPLSYHPFADTIALVLILLNFPNMAVATLHLLFSYNFHATTKTSIPASRIVLIDISVIILSSLITPFAGQICVDLSHAIIATSLSGARRLIPLPLTLFLTGIRIMWTRRTPTPPLTYAEIGNLGFASKVLFRLRSIMPTDSRVAFSQHDPPRFWNSVMEFAKRSIAIHVCVAAFLQVLQSLLVMYGGVHKEMPMQDIAPMQDNNDLVGESCISSIWEHLLRLRADSSGRRHELTQVSQGSRRSRLWISEISARAIVLNISAPGHEMPAILVLVNGLARTTNVSPIQVPVLHHKKEQTFASVGCWAISIDNLSVRTEYDISLEIRSSDGLDCHALALCTTNIVTGAAMMQDSRPAFLPDEAEIADDESVANEQKPQSSNAQSSIVSLEEMVAGIGVSLEEKRQSFRRARRDNSKKIQLMQRDLEHIATRVAGTNDKTEQRVQGRMLSLQTEIKRIQDNIEEMELEKHNASDRLESQKTTWTLDKAKRDHEAGVLDEERLKYNTAKVEHERRLGSVESEAFRLKAKADKLSLRRTKIQQDLDRIAFEQDEILHQEFQDRNSAREAVKHTRLQTEADYLKMIHELQQRAEFLELYGSAQPI